MAETDTDDWGATERLAPADRLDAEALIVDVDGFEGPLDLLLMLSRTQKVDLRKISVLQLAEQYLKFVRQAAALRIELAADYLVMAAWLAFLKSRLLLPPEPGEAGPSAEDLAAHLAFQLERLQAMREAAARLMARDQFGRDFFARGLPEAIIHNRDVTYEATLLDLMRAYARIRTKDEFRPMPLIGKTFTLWNRHWSGCGASWAMPGNGRISPRSCPMAGTHPPHAGGLPPLRISPPCLRWPNVAKSV